MSKGVRPSDKGDSAGVKVKQSHVERFVMSVRS